MFEDTGKNVKTELRDVRILKWGTDAQGNTITAKGADVPDEVPVYTDGNRSVGRATLRVKEDGLYADIVLSIGTLEGMEATAIIRPIQTEALKETRVIASYEVRAVGLNEIPKAATKVNETPDTDQTPAQE